MKISFLPKQIYFEWFTGGHLFNFKVERQNYLIVSLKFIRVSFSPHRLIKSNHAETFLSKLFPSVSRWPENLKVLLFLNVSLFLRVRGIGVRRLEITVISRFAIICLLSNGRDSTPVSPSPPSFKCFNPLSFRGTTRPALFPRMSLGPGRENCLLLFISNLIFVALSAATVVVAQQPRREQLWLKG